MKTVLLAAGLLAAPICVTAHDHANPDGTTTSWYPHECCHDGDCRPVAKIVVAKQGRWLTTVDGQTVLIGPSDARRPSKDARWHVCILPADGDGPPRVACIFEPAES